MQYGVNPKKNLQILINGRPTKHPFNPPKCRYRIINDWVKGGNRRDVYTHLAEVKEESKDIEFDKSKFISTCAI